MPLIDTSLATSLTDRIALMGGRESRGRPHYEKIILIHEWPRAICDVRHRAATWERLSSASCRPSGGGPSDPSSTIAV